MCWWPRNDLNQGLANIVKWQFSSSVTASSVNSDSGDICCCTILAISGSSSARLAPSPGFSDHFPYPGLQRSDRFSYPLSALVNCGKPAHFVSFAFLTPPSSADRPAHSANSGPRGEVLGGKHVFPQSSRTGSTEDVEERMDENAWEETTALPTQVSRQQTQDERACDYE